MKQCLYHTQLNEAKISLNHFSTPLHFFHNSKTTFKRKILYTFYNFDLIRAQEIMYSIYSSPILKFQVEIKKQCRRGPKSFLCNFSRWQYTKYLTAVIGFTYGLLHFKLSTEVLENILTVNWVRNFLLNDWEEKVTDTLACA